MGNREGLPSGENQRRRIIRKSRNANAAPSVRPKQHLAKSSPLSVKKVGTGCLGTCTSTCKIPAVKVLPSLSRRVSHSLPKRSTRHVTPVSATRISGKPVSTVRSCALAKCCRVATECSNHPSLVTVMSKSAPKAAKRRVRSPRVSSKQMSGPILMGFTSSCSKDGPAPESKSYGTLFPTIQLKSGKVFRKGIYSPNGTRWTLL